MFIRHDEKQIMMENETSFGIFGNVLLFGRELMNFAIQLQ
jgi:hypothetical protein